jgi:hypothetical protein
MASGACRGQGRAGVMRNIEDIGLLEYIIPLLYPHRP